MVYKWASYVAQLLMLQESKIIVDFTLSLLSPLIYLSPVFLNIVKHSRDQRTKISTSIVLGGCHANSAALEENNWMNKQVNDMLNFNFLVVSDD